MVLLEVVNAIILWLSYVLQKNEASYYVQKNPPLTSDKKDMEAETSS